MWGKVKTLLLLLSLSINVPFLVVWASRGTRVAAVETAPSASPATPRNLTPRVFPPPRPDGSRGVYRDVAVTEEQWHEIEPRLAKFRTAMFVLGRDMKKQRDELVELVAAPELDMVAIQAKQEELLESHRKSGELVTQNMLADRDVLSPEQHAKFFKKLRDYCAPPTTNGMASPRPSNGKFGPAPNTYRPSR
jgi:Spy/CpxP family protein refolding chaperone